MKRSEPSPGSLNGLAGVAMSEAEARYAFVVFMCVCLGVPSEATKTAIRSEASRQSIANEHTQAPAKPSYCTYLVSSYVLLGPEEAGSRRQARPLCNIQSSILNTMPSLHTPRASISVHHVVQNHHAQHARLQPASTEEQQHARMMEKRPALLFAARLAGP